MLFYGMAPLPCPAQEGEYILEDEYKPTYNVQLKIAAEGTTNLYSSGESPQSDTVVRTNLFGTMEYPRGADSMLRLDFDITQNDYQKFAAEDYLDAAFDASWEQPLGAGRAGLRARRRQTDASNQALASFSNHGQDLEAFYSQALGARDTLRVTAGVEKETYGDYASLDTDAHMWSAAISHDFGDFIYGDISYGVKRKHFPGEAIVDISYSETPQHRSDRASTFTASVSRLLSFYPLAYVQVTFERITNTSDSNGYYFWFNETTFDYGEKLLPGFDNYTETAWSVFAMRDLSEKTSLSAYYLADKIHYPHRFTGNFGQTEPFQPTDNTLTYLMVDVQHAMNPGLTADLSRTWVNSRSNEPLYQYKEQVTSLGFIAKF